MKYLKKINEHKLNNFEDSEYLKKLVTRPDDLKIALEKGLDPLTKTNLLLRVCFRDNLVESFNILVDKIVNNNITMPEEGTVSKLMSCKYAAENCRIEFLKKFDEVGWFDNFDDNDWADLLSWLKISRKYKDEDDNKKKTTQFILDLRKTKSIL